MMKLEMKVKKSRRLFAEAFASSSKIQIRGKRVLEKKVIELVPIDSDDEEEEMKVEQKFS